VGGYYLVFWGWRINAHRELLQRLDAGNYELHETVEIKIPITIPYPLQSRDHERTNGKFEHQGEYYKLVTQRYANDTLYVICIKDRKEKQIDVALNDFNKLSNDLPTSEKSSGLLLAKLLKEYESNHVLVLIPHDGWMKSSLSLYTIPYKPEVTLPVQSPPPDLFIQDNKNFQST
jgi:hypothetical protein